MKQLVVTMEGWFSKLPALPREWKEVIVKVTPWIALIFGVFGVLGGISALGILSVFSPFAVLGGGVGGAQAVGMGVLASILLLVSSALMLIAFPGTNARKEAGWNFLFWSQAVSVVSAVLSFSPVGVLLSGVGFYILFQIKSYYK